MVLCRAKGSGGPATGGKSCKPDTTPKRRMLQAASQGDQPPPKSPIVYGQVPPPVDCCLTVPSIVQQYVSEVRVAPFGNRR